MTTKILARFQKMTKSARQIVITTHEYPDADGIGSEIALGLALNTLGRKAICVNECPLLDRYKYLDPADLVISSQEFQARHPTPTIDLLIVTDANSLERIGANMKKLAAQASNVLFIDHHPARKPLPEHCIDTTMSATGELVGRLIESLNIPFEKQIALPLYTSILIDTSSFRYPTVTSKTHQLISKLLACGIDPAKAYTQIYGTKKISYLRFLGSVLAKSESSDDGRVAWIRLSEQDLARSQIDPEDTHGFINHLLILNVEAACMFRQLGDKVKVSLRSAGKTDVGHIALRLGGGGHNHSAATILTGTLDQAITRTLAEIKAFL